MMLIAILSGLIIGPLVWLSFNWILSFSTKKIPGIYVQPGFWYPLKYVFIRVMLWWRKRQNSKARSSGEDVQAGYGIQSKNSPDQMEQVQHLSEIEPLAVDAVYFNAGNEEADVFFVAATARRQENIVQPLLYVKLPDIGLLELPSLPDTWVTDKNSDKSFTASGLTLTPVKPMAEWTISYNGPLRKSGSKATMNVEFDLTWKGWADYFDFDTDLHPHTMADSIARERWSREYFDTLKKSHQTHYEQFGEITGVVKVEGHGDHQVRIQGVRDHSYGNVRDWKYFHRYAINYATLQDGTALCVGAISMPISLSRLTMGYVFKPDGSKHPVSSSDFEFHEWGEDGNPPKELTINFVAGKDRYNLVCTVVDSAVFYMGKEWDAKIHERFCSYTVNGVKGWGISEWEYRNYDGKDVEMKRLQSL